MVCAGRLPVPLAVVAVSARTRRITIQSQRNVPRRRQLACEMRQNRERNITMKSTKHSNDKKINRNPSLNITQWYLLGAFLFPWLSWLFERGRDGLQANHNEMFLADVS